MSARSDSVLKIIATIALVLWAGATWTAGYIFAPILFHAYGREQAGEIAGRLFHAVNLIGLFAAMLILLDYRVRFSKTLQHQSGLWVLLLVLFSVIVQYIGLTPMMESAKISGDIARFGLLHGVSQVVYLLQSVGLAYLIYDKFHAPS